MSTRRMLPSSGRSNESSGKAPAPGFFVGAEVSVVAFDVSFKVGVARPLAQDHFPARLLALAARESVRYGTIARTLLLRICTKILRMVVAAIGANDPGWPRELVSVMTDPSTIVSPESGGTFVGSAASMATVVACSSTLVVSTEIVGLPSAPVMVVFMVDIAAGAVVMAVCLVDTRLP